MSKLEGQLITDRMAQRQSKRGEIEMVLTCVGQRCWLYWEMDAED